MKSSAKKVELAPYDDLFSTEESRQDAKLEKVREIPLSELHPFKNHPFKVKDDEAMMETADSVRQYGVLVPAIARPDPEGGYELVAGHRRHRASELAEKETMPVIVRDLDDDTENILKGKVFCGCCGGKMQRKRGTNHTDWYFFTCNTNNRLRAGKCTGMYVREEDIFSAIYHQLKLYIQEHFISSLQYDEEMAQLKAKLDAQVEFRHAIAENPAIFYEQYILGEISLDEFKAKQQKLRQAAEYQKAIELEIEESERVYSRFSCLCKVRDKELPLSTIMSEINKIVVDAGKKVVVQWNKIQKVT